VVQFSDSTCSDPTRSLARTMMVCLRCPGTHPVLNLKAISGTFLGMPKYDFKDKRIPRLLAGAMIIFFILWYSSCAQI
jgi:hypothetical protein